MAKYILPGIGGQLNAKGESPEQTSPLLRYYSPRLFGAPPQLTNQCDMRIMSSDGVNPGPVGDFYLTKILQDANVANFVIGNARFIGGMSSLANILREAWFYGTALSKYEILNSSGEPTAGGNNPIEEQSFENAKLRYQAAYGERNNEAYTTASYEDSTILDISSLKGSEEILKSIERKVGVSGEDAVVGGATFMSSLLTSLSAQQPFYTFEDNWYTYINNVKMMINTAVIMLGLQKYCVRIGDTYYPIGANVKIKDPNNDVWANYRYITPTSDLGSVTAVNTDNGETSQYVSFMIDPASITESYNNSIGESQMLSSVINQGSTIGNEIAFISNSTAGGGNDSSIELVAESKRMAEKTIADLSSGSGRFTAAIASSMARSYVGEHTIYPDVFQSHSATSSMSMTVHLSSDSGDPYAYFINILVPLFFILGMALPQLSNNNASSYSFPPVVQCNIPGFWGTRLGMIDSVSVNKNPNQKDLSINGYPLQVDVTISVKDLQHVLLTSPMNRPAVFLNNQTMFDYIAQISGVDKYRVNGSMRTVARLALAVSATENFVANVGDALLTDWHSFINKKFGYQYQ